MRGDTTTENEAEDHEGSAAASGERRPSVVTLQNMLKKVSQSPFHNQFQTPVSTTSDSSGSSVNKSENRQDSELLGHLSAAATDMTDNQQLHLSQNVGQETLRVNPQNGVNGGLARSNPFYTHYLESGNNGSKTSQEVKHDTIFGPPAEFLSPETKTVESGDESSELPKDIFEALTRPLPPARNKPSNGHFNDVTVNSSDLFKPIPPPKTNLSKTLPSKSSDLFKNDGVSLFQAAKGEDSLHAGSTKEVNLFDKSPSGFVDPFKSASTKEDDPFWSPQPTKANPFHTATTKGADLFQAAPTKSGENKQDPFTKEDLFGTSSSKENLDVFSSSSTKTVDPFPSPIQRDFFQEVSSVGDPFAPSKQDDPFKDVSKGKSYIFQPLPSKFNGKDIFGKTSSDSASKPAYTTPSLDSPSETKLDMLSSPDFLKATPAESHPDVPPKSFNKPQDILQPSPFSRARNLSMTPSQASAEMAHVRTFKRPPRPLPRTRPPKTEKPPQPDKPPKPERPPPPVKPIESEPAPPKTSPKPAFKQLPKPVVPRKLKTLESKPVDSDDSAVFEDVLLIGQECCVEDWPEDSPELNPDFKPSGTLRLRRESMKMKVDSDGGSGEDQDGSGIQGKDRKFSLSRVSRRGSKEKFPDDTKEGRSRTLSTSRKSSKEYFSEYNMSAEENDDGEQYGLDYKKKHLKTKVNQLLRRASTSSSMSEGKHMNGHLPQESKQDDDLNKKSAKKNSVIRRWSEGVVLDDQYDEEQEEEEEEEEEGGGAQHEEVDGSGFVSFYLY
ncbi:proteoglycan 4-like isoform X2 [Centropristis striata]|uniref:proteoglycan 4-like isoform X2 n=1 Tax=Centropristis striata TaxID=184440 RepID=UPI0027E1C47E|nr:proteoglycan 4-like isoform X2 [Centropristis striata]